MKANKLSAFFIVLIWLNTNLTAQDFSPLMVGSAIETTHLSFHMEDKIVTLHNFYSVQYLNNELYYDSLLMVMPSLNATFASLIIYNKNMHPVNELSFKSTKDSIFVYQNFLIRQLDSLTQQKEIVVFGTLLTPLVKTRVALWLDEALNEKRKIVYNPELFFYIKNFSAPFTINNKGNLVTNVNGSTIELNHSGEVVQRSKYLLGQTFFQNHNSDYLTPLPQGLSIANNNFEFIEFKENEYLDYPVLLPTPHYKYIVNLEKNYLLLTSITAFDFDCEPGENRNVIMKYNTETYEAETFYQDELDMCDNWAWNVTPVFNMDYYLEDYIFICNKHVNCGFINLDIDGENICNVEFIEVLCINKDGQLRWRRELGGDASYWHRGLVATPDSGCVVFSNRYERGINTGEESDLYYVKLNSRGKTVKPVPVSINESPLLSFNSIQLYPNPFNNLLRIQPNHHPNQNLFIEIYDVQGQLVLAQKVNQSTISVAHLSSGVYTALAKQGDKTIQMDKLLKL